MLAAGTGLRQGEAFGLTVDRVDFLRRELRVDRQLVLLPGAPPVRAPPKTDASYRTVPLPDVVLDALARIWRSLQPAKMGLFSPRRATSQYVGLVSPRGYDGRR